MMKINFNVTGTNRKSLVGAISQILNAPTQYTGVPTFAYKVSEYTIDKTGTVTGPDSRELVADLQSQHNFAAVSEEYDTPETESEEYPDIDQHHPGCMVEQRGRTSRATRPGQYADPNVPPTEAMLRQAEAWAGRTQSVLLAHATGMKGQPDFESLPLTEREELGLGRERRENYQGENGMMASDLPERYRYRAELSDPDAPERMEVFIADDDEEALRQAYEYATGGVTLLELHELDEDYNEIRKVDIPRDTSRLVIEMPKDGFTETSIANLRKLVESKAALIKKAVGADSLPVEETDDTLNFPWFAFNATPEAVDAYARFISALCAMAKEQKRITAKAKEVPNEKYAFRCFLLRLGFIGDEYKAARKILLAGLEGNGSFRQTPVRADTEAPEEGIHEMFDEVYTPPENIGALTAPDIKTVF